MQSLYRWCGEKFRGEVLSCRCAQTCACDSHVLGCCACTVGHLQPNRRWGVCEWRIRDRVRMGVSPG